MEIERKWMVKGWPEESASLPLVREQLMRQGYVTVYPTVRIREEAEKGGSTEYILCFKSPPSRGGLSRKEIEFPITPEQFAQLEDLIGYPLIPKLRRSYRLADGLLLEVNLVDQGMETEFMYAEIEYETEEQARSWNPADSALSEYLNDEVTGQPRQTMGAYWQTTRVRAGAK
jgi:CYTH domain-containing protein